MKNQFVYTVKFKKEEEEVQLKRSFNIEMVAFSMQFENGEVLVVLNDMHERKEDVVSTNKNGKKTLMKKINTVQSEINLSKEDGERFYELVAL